MAAEGETILAIVTLDRETLVPGGAPIFVAETPEAREKIASYLGHILNAQVHDLENGTYVIVRH